MTENDTDQTAPIGRSRRRLLLIAAMLLAPLLILWLVRQRIATELVDRHLAAAHVPAAYRITRLGPFSQRIEGLRLGDPARPDLTARRIDLHWRYGLAGPVLAKIEGEGIRLAGRWRDGRLSLGTIDRLLPQGPSGGPLLPDLAATLRDAHLSLATPAGRIGLWLTGSGNLARAYRADARLDAPALALGGCTIDRASARLAVRIDRREPQLRGPIAIRGAACPGQSLTIGAGVITTDLTLAPGLDRARGRLAPAGLAARSGSVALGGLGGSIAIDAAASHLRGRADLRGTALSAAALRADAAAVTGAFVVTRAERSFTGALALTDMTAQRALAATLTQAGQATAGTPLAPLAAHAGRAIRAMLAGADAEAQVAFATRGTRRSLRIDQARLRAHAGNAAEARLSATSDAGRWVADAGLAGDGLPTLALRASGYRNGAPLAAVLRMEPYAAGGARLALTPLRIGVADGALRFATVATIDGPLGPGRITRLSLPLVGVRDARGAFRIGDGCLPIAFERVALPGLELDPARLAICGAPVVARGSDGAVAVAATIGTVALTGRAGSAPLTLRAGRLRLAADRRFAIERLEVLLDAAAGDPTRLAVGTLDGRVGADGLAGAFADAAGSIRNVPLGLSGAAGQWQLDGGALRLTGALGIADRAEAARFHPLAASDVTLALVDGRIDAAGTLRTPGRPESVARVTLRHDLAQSAGGASIDVPALTFARGGLQPEMLTPLTLGVVANVAGTISGAGRIDWTPQGVTSSGDFRSDRIDLAAAFGPVAGLAGTIHFADLLGLVTPPGQEVRIAEINPGVAVANGIAHYRLIGGNRVRIEDAYWPFAGGTLTLDPTTLDFGRDGERRLTFRIAKLDAAAFVQQLDFPNIAATGTFDGLLPMAFDATGGRIEAGTLRSEGGGTLAYVGELSNAQLGTMGKLAFDALKAIRYSTLDVRLDGKLDGEIVSRVRFEGVHQATGDTGIIARMIRNLPFRFNIQIRAPFRGLVGTARSYINPALLLQSAAPGTVQPGDSAPVR